MIAGCATGSLALTLLPAVLSVIGVTSGREKKSVAGTMLASTCMPGEHIVEGPSNNRKLTDGERSSIAVSGKVGKHLTYDQLTSKTRKREPSRSASLVGEAQESYVE